MEPRSIEPSIVLDDQAILAQCRTKPWDTRAGLALIASGVAHAIFVAMFFFAPPSPSALTLDSYETYSHPSLVSLLPLERDPFEQPSEVAAPRLGPSEDTGAAPSHDPDVHRRPRASRPADTRTREDRARAALDVLGSFLRDARADGLSPYAHADSIEVDGYGQAMGNGGLRLDMQGVGRGAGGNPNDAISVTGFGMAGYGVTCSEEVVRPDGVILAAGCNGHRPDGSLYGIAGRGARQEGARVPRTLRVCGGASRCDPNVQGGLTREQVRRVVARQRAQIGYCYEQALASRPDLRGRVTAQWIVAADGHVAIANIDGPRSDVGSAAVEACVVAAVRRWTFPEADAITAVTYPFVLEAND